MFRLKVGEYELTNNPLYIVKIPTGLSPASATINRSVVGNNDGAKFNSSRINERNIVLHIYFQGDVEAARINLYKYFKMGQSCRLYFSNNSRSVYIDGYVETAPCDFFVQKEFIQISIICNNPFFRSVSEKVSEMSLVTPLFEFPFSISAEGVELSRQSDITTAAVYNGGDVESGMTIELYASGTVVNPSIIDAETLERFDLKFTMMSGDKIVINTVKNERSVTLIRYGSYINLINAIGKYPDWLQLAVGENSYTYLAEGGVENLTVTIRHTDLYTGV